MHQLLYRLDSRWRHVAIAKDKEHHQGHHHLAVHRLDNRWRHVGDSRWRHVGGQRVFILRQPLASLWTAGGVTLVARLERLGSDRFERRVDRLRPCLYQWSEG